MSLFPPVYKRIDGTIPLETLRKIAKDHPHARIGNVVERLQALVVADALKPRVKPKPRVRVKAGRMQIVNLRIVE